MKIQYIVLNIESVNKNYVCTHRVDLKIFLFSYCNLLHYINMLYIMHIISDL